MRHAAAIAAAFTAGAAATIAAAIYILNRA
jgi:hypothetical protein